MRWGPPWLPLAILASACSAIVDGRLDDRSEGEEPAPDAAREVHVGVLGGDADSDMRTRFDGGTAGGDAARQEPVPPWAHGMTTSSPTDAGGKDAHSDEQEPPVTEDAAAPAAQGAEDISAITTGEEHSCVLARGSIRCWGTRTKDRLRAPAGHFVAVAAGGEHTCALDIDQALHCWGANVRGQALAPSGRFKAVASGHEHSCAIDLDDRLQCWGNDDSDQASPPSGRFADVALGRTHSCAIASADGRIVCWGEPGLRSEAPAGAFEAIDVGATHACALPTGGRIVCWGQNTDGRTDAYPGPFTTVHVSDAVSCGLTKDGAASCWGSSSVLSLPQEERFRLFSWNFHRGCGVTSEGRLLCWDLAGDIGTIPNLDADR